MPRVSAFYSDPYALMVTMYWDGQSFSWFDATFDDFYQILQDYPEASFDIHVQTLPTMKRR